MQLKFGKYAGSDLKDVPIDYIEWLVRDCEDKLLVYKSEVERRKIRVENSVMMAIVSKGYDALTKDLTVNPQDAIRAKEALEKAIREAAGLST